MLAQASEISAEAADLIYACIALVATGAGVLVVLLARRPRNA